MILGLDAWVFWLIVMVIFAVIEILTVNLVTIWFAGGALAAMIAAFCDTPVPLQILIAVGIPGILLAIVLIFKPFDKFHKRENVPTNSDRMIGQEALVLTTLKNLDGGGTVKVKGQVWSAVSEDDSDINEGEKVMVRGISGVKLIVKRIER